MSARVTRSWARTGRRASSGSSERGRPNSVLGWKTSPLRTETGSRGRPARHRRRGRSPSSRPRRRARARPRGRRCCGSGRVQHAPGEAPRVVGHERVPEMPVGDDHAVVGAALAVGGRDLPAVEAVRAERPRRGDGRVEADVRAQAVVGGEAQDVVAHLVAAREQRILRRHREPVEARRVARRDQVQALVVGVPVPADAIAALEAVDGESFVAQHLERAEPGGAGADHAVVASRHAAEYRGSAPARARAD